MQTILGPISDQIGCKTGFNQRHSKVTGSVFMQTLVFSSLEDPDWRYPSLVAAALDAGVKVTKQGLAQRFSPASAEMARQVLGAAVQIVIQTQSAAPPLLERFNGVYIRDSSVISLPKGLETIWSGCATRQGSSAALAGRSWPRVANMIVARPFKPKYCPKVPCAWAIWAFSRSNSSKRMMKTGSGG